MSILTAKKTRNLITICIYLVIAVFVIFYIRKLDFSKLADLQPNWWFIAAAIPASILSRVFLPYIWIKLIKIYDKVDNPGDYWQLNYIYAKSWLGRYIPGKVAWIGGKIYFALKQGISKTVLGVTSLVEAVIQLLAALLIGVAFLYISGTYANFSAAYNVFFLCATIIGTVTILPPVFNRLLAMGYKLVKKKVLDPRYYVKLGDMLKITTLYCLVHALSALPIYFLIRAIGYELSFVELLYVVGAFIFAGAIGTLAIVAPSGLGVREGVTLLFLANVLPLEIAVVVVVLLRLWSIVLDLVYWALSYVVTRITGRLQTTLQRQKG